MSSPDYDIIIVGTGPAGLGAAFHLAGLSPSLSILMVDREKICSGGLLNDCKQNYTYPIGFAADDLDQGRGRAAPAARWRSGCSPPSRRSRTSRSTGGGRNGSASPCSTSARPMSAPTAAGP